MGSRNRPGLGIADGGGYTMKPFTEGFYLSPAWKRCRASYIKSRGGLCERCLREGRYRAGVIVHHKTHLSPENIHDPEITLGFDNLELLCRDCHAAVHSGKEDVRYTVDRYGHIVPR